MREIKYPSDGRSREERSFYSIFYEFYYYKEFIEFYCNKNSDYKIFEKYLDLFKKYIDDIIDYSDEFFCISRSNGMKQKLKSIKHHQEKIMLGDDEIKLLIYNISNREDKNKLKKIISFNIIYVNYDEAIHVPFKKNYLRNPNKKHRIKEYIYFIKNDENFFTFGLDTGYIFDYRSEKLYYEHLDKYNALTKERIKLKKDFYVATKQALKEKIEEKVESYKNLSNEPYLSFCKVYHIFYEFLDDLAFNDLLRYSENNNNYTIVEKYLDLFKSFIDDIIDYSDEFICYGREDSMKPILDTVPHYTVRKKYVMGESNETVYSIKEEKYKDILKDNLSFNVSVCGEEAWIIPIDRKYLRNDERNIWHDRKDSIRFLKDGREIFYFDLDIGEISSSLKLETSKELLNKYNNNSKERIKLIDEFISIIQKQGIEYMKNTEKFYKKQIKEYVKK